ncbi:hypothetical protein QP179_10655 [Sphingomonas aurantiaca]|uniref:hypothetical protein n=1 Tax=Sphingomonas aurantiaca TaxID=185949 RepID=UPI002FE1DBBE
MGNGRGGSDTRGLILLVGYLKFDKLDVGDIFQLLAALLGSILAVVGALYVETRKKAAEWATEAGPAVEVLAHLKSLLVRAVAAQIEFKHEHEEALASAFDQVEELRRFPPRHPQTKLLLDQVANGRSMFTSGLFQRQIVAASNDLARPDELEEPNRTLNGYIRKIETLLTRYEK